MSSVGASPTGRTGTVTVTDFGAVGDGTVNDATAIQAAIDACHGRGGGRVVIPAGRTFLSGSIQLRSHVELHLEPGAVLAAHPDEAAYSVRRRTGALSDNQPGRADPSPVFISAEGCRQVSITGTGTIDGGGRHYVLADLGPIYTMAPLRPFTIYLTNCERVRITDVEIRDAAYWTLRLSGCRDVTVHAITIANDLKLPNCDGIDIDTCQGVRVSDCHISTADDGICLKTCLESREYGECRDITVSGCTITSKSSGVCVGSEIASPIRNCVVTACVISASNRGLALQLSEPGGVSNVMFSDIIVETRFFDTRWWGHGEPIYVASYPWRGSGGTARNIRFRNILARSENGVLVRAEEPGCVSGVVLEGVRVEIDRWSGHPGGHWDLRPHPANDVVPHDTSGIHLERVSDVRIRDCEVVWAQPTHVRDTDLGAALTVVEVSDLHISDFAGGGAHPSQAAVVVDGHAVSTTGPPNGKEADHE
ncbi:Glycosyl hydrolases family 28 [Actinopolymorpha cephalotaxi]|uniref:Glycosyl hydrolases family 28 n=1 Tax=Actinopolymorpha cephalotaxi TaxID=504797 RepID=A0A1I3CBX0_9ACTN|nr:glycosyl hydrolase family 28 protein [Actinopolymorpha cephalotaxi]NYH86735.1 polygalacturonase [Actinopolymorpha cephalotaxi]SFH71541.1 Glycosyl hydrolases family 28 [Actinopolymorpha cephalotaxi]